MGVIAEFLLYLVGFFLMGDYSGVIGQQRDAVRRLEINTFLPGDGQLGDVHLDFVNRHGSDALERVREVGAHLGDSKYFVHNYMF